MPPEEADPADHAGWPDFKPPIAGVLSQLTQLRELSLRHFRRAPAPVAVLHLPPATAGACCSPRHESF